MKKRVKKIVEIIICILVIFCIIKVLKKDHNINYSIDKYTINEKFYIKEKEHQYDIIIENKKNDFSYSLNEKLGKSKKIIKDIKSYKKDNLVCIIPIYKKDIINNIYCNLKGEAVSNNYLVETDNEDFKVILKKIKKYKINIPNSSDKKVPFKKIEVYKKNIPQGFKYIIWNYKGIYILSNDELLYQKILNYDLYDNIMSTIVDKYYVLFENTSVNGIENIYYYDLYKNKLNTLKLKDKLSKDSYINGVINNLIYVTDRKEKKQYTINIKKKRVEEVGNEIKLYQKYHNGKPEILSKSDFFMSDQYFDNEAIKDKILTSKTLRRESNYYYYLEEDKMYRALNNNKKHPILLFELSDIKEWKIINQDILIVREDTLCFYSEENGLMKIAKSNELNYNYENICNVWKK